jgi:hypothetical protein
MNITYEVFSDLTVCWLIFLIFNFLEKDLEEFLIFSKKWGLFLSVKKYYLVQNVSRMKSNSIQLTHTNFCQIRSSSEMTSATFENF